MDKKKGILNIGTSIVSKVILLLVALYMRRLLILYIGNEVNGPNSLYASIIGLLSVAELGVGSAIIFSMYSPIVRGDNKKVAALYCLYRKLYRIIGFVIFVAGLALMPFLPNMISDYNSLDVDVYLTFFLTLVSVVISYENNVFGAKKKNRIKQWISKLRNPSIRNGRSFLCRELCSKYVDLIDIDIIDKLEMIGMYMNKTEYRKKLIKSNELINCSGESVLEYKMKIRLGLI